MDLMVSWDSGGRCMENRTAALLGGRRMGFYTLLPFISTYIFRFCFCILPFFFSSLLLSFLFDTSFSHNAALCTVITVD
ncbi:hypothetical protein M440DRAFT_1169562 [Trichoderma longibrachiatum ATCC 18648]|uniref:Uncharacterized protein n=1 Tax=Trichoderma longibrachiatum ATCC 18648 TaxID=983965 RepID=A0A2T4CD13_TRILO|nr:hypothetical protein M440DRAFT_1169562 [Trichoderma longibrachiatum ATCC 18648]